MNTVFLGLGGNLGDRRRILRDAVRGVRQWPATREVRVSCLYETDYVGPGEDQAPYYNAVVEMVTQLSPFQLLERARRLEGAAGRRPDGHMQPRPLDVDVLMYGELQLVEAHLVVPHPRMHLRRFVLEPLAELAPHVVVPGMDLSVAQCLENPELESQRVRVVENSDWCSEATAWTS